MRTAPMESAGSGWKLSSPRRFSAIIAAAQAFIDTEQVGHGLAETGDQLPTAHLPVGTAEDHEEVVAADMGDKSSRSSVASQSQAASNWITSSPSDSRSVVERLEIVDIDIDRDEGLATDSMRSTCSLIGTLPGNWVSGLA